MNQANQPVAIITGASSGIGAATARKLAQAGYRLTLAARRRERLEQLQAELAKDGADVLVAPTDVTQRDQVEAMAKQTVERFGQIDALINNAGVMPLSFIKNLHVDEWMQMIDVNLKGPLLAVAACLPTMIGQNRGHIVNVSSIAGRTQFPAGTVYCGTKHALNAISDGLRNELTSAHNIKVTTIEPGAVTTELTQAITDPEVPGHLITEKLRPKQVTAPTIANGPMSE
ncbi:MAG: SDR family oxidoreductase [Nannocystaceae bacterium]